LTKRRKSTPGRLLTKKLDSAFSELVRRRSKGVCAMSKVLPDVCESPVNDWRKMDNSHTAHSRVYSSLRYDFDNCDALCKSCHFKVHKNPLIVHDFKWKQLGSEGMRRLIDKRNTIIKRFDHDKQELLDEIERELAIERENDYNYGE